MRLPSPVWLVLLCSATASAHEAPFRAAWVQPLAPIFARNLIVPVGLNHGLVPGIDLTMELTPYAGLLALAPVGMGFNDGSCAIISCTASGVYGLVATVGVALERPFFSTADWEADLFVGPKVLVAIATQLGGPTLAVGTSYEFGGGADLGVEIHARRFGFYVAIVIGVQVTAAFSTGPFIIPASGPVAAVSSPPMFMRSRDLMTVPNLNLVRLGWVF